MTEWIVTSGVLIGVVIGLRFLLRSRISGRLRYGLWLLVLLRLLIPFSLPSALSVMNLLPDQASAASPVHQEISVPSNPTAQVPYEPTVQSAPLRPQISIQQPLPQTSQTPEVTQKEPIRPEVLLSVIWVGGMVLSGLVLICANVLFFYRLCKSRKAFSHPCCSLPVYRSHQVQTPCLYGIFRPSVYLPASMDTPDELQYALTHEWTHYRHGDHIWALLRCFCLVIHWYNPLVWCAAVLSRQDAELACDEAVIRRLGETHRSEYGKTLIKMACLQPTGTGLFTASTSMLTTKKSLKERISMIAKKPKTAVITLVLVLLTAIVAASCTFTGKDTASRDTTSSLSFQDGEAVYAREKGGFGSDFLITLYEDGRFHYYEGDLSSYIGYGNWTLEKDILTLNNDDQNVRFSNRFHVAKDKLVWLGRESTGFTYGSHMSIADGDLFLLQSPQPAQLSYMPDICYFPQDYMDGGPLGCFVHIDGTTYVWDHNVTGTLRDMQTKEIGTVAHRDDTVIPDAQLSACRIPEGTVLYKGKDAGKSKYEAIYYKLEGFDLYARMLPVDAYRGADRWWETATIHDGSQELTTDTLRKLQEEKGKLLSRADLQQYSYVIFSDTVNAREYRLYQVDTDYRLLLVSGATVTDVEAFQARFYHKDIPNYWVDLMTTDIDEYQKNLTNNQLAVIAETEIIYDLEGFVTLTSVNSGTPCRIQLEKNCVGNRHVDTQLVISSSTGTLREIISPSIGPMIPDGEKLYLADVDGDGVCEIILQEDPGGTGGLCCRVFKVEGNQLTTLFDGDDSSADTGFDWEIHDNYKLVVHNRITGNSWKIDAVDYMRSLYFDEAGIAVDSAIYPLEMDSFYEIYPKDVDGDGIHELCTTQYTFAGAHVDGVGDAKCVFKFNKASGSFQIIETDFVQYTE